MEPAGPLTCMVRPSLQTGDCVHATAHSPGPGIHTGAVPTIHTHAAPNICQHCTQHAPMLHLAHTCTEPSVHTGAYLAYPCTAPSIHHTAREHPEQGCPGRHSTLEGNEKMVILGVDLCASGVCSESGLGTRHPCFSCSG